MSDWFDTWNTPEIICPHCEYGFTDSWEYQDSDYIQCHSCEETFFCEVAVSITYTTSKIEEDE